jgi:hypothetical protein
LPQGDRRIAAVALALALAAAGCGSVRRELAALGDFHCRMVPASAADGRYVPQVGDLAGAEVSPDAWHDLSRLEAAGIIAVAYTHGGGPDMWSLVARFAAAGSARGDPGSWSSVFGDRTDEPTPVLADVTRGTGDGAEFWSADVVAAGQRVGSVYCASRGRHMLSFECRGVHLPRERLEAVMAPFVARMEEWPPEPVPGR